MQRRRAALRQLVYSSAVVIAQAGVPEGAAAETFEDSFAGGEKKLDWLSHPMLGSGAVEGNPPGTRPTATAGSASCGTKAAGLPR